MLKIILVTAVMFLTACAGQQFRMAEKPARSIPHYENSQSFFIYGIGQTQEVNASEVCDGGNKVAEVKSVLSPLDVVIGLIQRVFILVEIYSPRSVSVTCK